MSSYARKPDAAATTASMGLRRLSSSDRRKRMVAVGIGNFMERFDFAIYGYFAAIIGA